MTGQRFDAVKAVGRLRKFGVEERASCSARKINREQEDGLGKKKKKRVWGIWDSTPSVQLACLCASLNVRIQFDKKMSMTFTINDLKMKKTG